MSDINDTVSEPDPSDPYEKGLHMISLGENVFITGAAGTGKSYFLREIARRYQFADTTSFDAPKTSQSNVNRIITASTAISAGHVGGRTIHSALGVGYFQPYLTRPTDLYDSIVTNRFMLSKYRHLEMLIIDEISMIHPEMLDAIDYCFRRIRAKTAPFGGVQVIAIGDFLQLPCVDTSGRNRNTTVYAFQAKCWQALFPSFTRNYIELTYSHRQKTDSQLKYLLDIVRTWQTDTLPQEAKDLLSTRMLTEPEMDRYTYVFSKRANAANFNYDRLTKYSAKHGNEEIKTFRAQLKLLPYAIRLSSLASSERDRRRYVPKYPDSALVPEVLNVCVGAFVMLVKNLWPTENLVNGSQGIVLHIDDSGLSPIIFVAFFRTHDRADIDYLADMTPDQLHEEYRDRQKLDPLKYTVKSIAQYEYQSDMTSVTHFPIMLAYGLTIHKVQGLTISQIVIDAQTMFAYGQFYVALSRATNMDTMYLTNFDPDKPCVFASDEVIKFYSQFSSVVGTAPIEAIEAADNSLDPKVITE